MSRSGTDRWIRTGLLVLIVLSPLLFPFGVTLLSPWLNEAKARAMLAPFLLLAVAAMMLAPPLLFRGRGSAPGPSDEDSDGGGGGPSQPPKPPNTPRGGIPLPDAEPARVRLRDHAHRWNRRVRQRRPATERKPAPIPKQHDG